MRRERLQVLILITDILLTHSRACSYLPDFRLEKAKRALCLAHSCLRLRTKMEEELTPVILRGPIFRTALWTCAREKCGRRSIQRKNNLRSSKIRNILSTG